MREDAVRANQARSLFGLVGGALGILLTLAVVAIAATQQGSVLGATSTALVGIILGTVGYSLGARRLGTAAVVLSIVALIFGIAVNQGLVPGLERTDPIRKQVPG